MIFSRPSPSHPFSSPSSSLDWYNSLASTWFIFCLTWLLLLPDYICFPSSLSAETLFVSFNIHLLCGLFHQVFSVFLNVKIIPSFSGQFSPPTALPSTHMVYLHYIAIIHVALSIPSLDGIPPSISSPTGLAPCFGQGRGSELNWNWTELNKLSIYEIICFRVARIKWLLQWQYYSNSLISFDPLRSWLIK